MPLRFLVLLSLLLYAMAELALLVKVGHGLGILPTFLLLIAVSLLGMSLVRRQGLSMLGRLRLSLDAGRLPVAEAFDGMAILAAGLLLALPGFLSDVLALLLLLPPLRRLLYNALARRLPAGKAAGPRGGQGVIEGEFEEVEPPRLRPRESPPRRPGAA